LTRARDVANVLSTATSLATDVETAAAISSHNSATTSVHGISDTSALATQTYVQNNKGVKSGNTASRPASPSTGDIYSNTELGYPEFYSGNAWLPIGAIPTAPSSVTATDQGSGRAFNNGQASISFTPGTVPGATYTVTSSPGSYTATGSSSPIVITGLQSNTSYTYTVTASSVYGTSSPSAASAAVTATTVPSAPTAVSAEKGNTKAYINFTQSSTGGSTVTNYKYSTDGVNYTAFSPAQTTSQLTISNLTNGNSYSFYIKAVNANGDSAASLITNSITPSLPSTVTGGTLTSDSSYYYRTFTSSSDTLSISNSTLSATYVVVGGGAAGGACNGDGGGSYIGGGGGGGGGGVSTSTINFATGNYTVTVGAGGTGGNRAGGSGSPSSLIGGAVSVTSNGGGGGGWGTGNTAGAGGTGGSPNGGAGGQGGYYNNNPSGPAGGTGGPTISGFSTYGSGGSGGSGGPNGTGIGSAGGTNTGNGANGSGYSANGPNGGSGVVVVRYLKTAII
jgi:hypothetical protein